MCITGEDIDELRRRGVKCRKCKVMKFGAKYEKCACNGTTSVTSELIHVDTNDEQHKLAPNRTPIYESVSQHGNSYNFGALEQQVNEIKKGMQRMEMKLEEKYKVAREEQLNVREWKAVAMVLDRVFFIIYVVLIGLSLVVLFPRPNDEMKRLFDEM